MNENPDNVNLSNNHIVAVISGEESAKQAAQDLLDAGYTDPILLTGEEGAREIDASGEHGHLFARILGVVTDHLSEETNFLKQYEEEAREGKHVVAVEVPSREEADVALEVLERNGGRNIRFFGKLAVTDLTPESNPTARAEASPELTEPT